MRLGLSRSVGGDDDPVDPMDPSAYSDAPRLELVDTCNLVLYV